MFDVRPGFVPFFYDCFLVNPVEEFSDILPRKLLNGNGMVPRDPFLYRGSILIAGPA